jgi:inhibitor of cysteine peptidase
MRPHTVTLITIMVSLALLAAGCNATPDAALAPDATDGGAAALVNVESVEVRVLESFPVQVEAVARGTLPEGCAGVGDESVSRKGDVFEVTLPSGPSDLAVCSAEPASFETAIPLDVQGLAAGTYMVDVNGVTTTFELAVDNVAQEPAGGASTN